MARSITIWGLFEKLDGKLEWKTNPKLDTPTSICTGPKLEPNQLFLDAAPHINIACFYMGVEKFGLLSSMLALTGLHSSAKYSS